ncbi:MAG: hypothetical protein HYW25_04590 [Candidatus Aenigmarchaeota archaeon]|nr:hypothetical protein [Candidatus Aenigmarchaeota archaeon]
MKGTVSKYPECIHWHFKKGRQRGTLEITLWKEQRRIWFNVQAERTADWIDESVSKLKKSIERELASC